MIFNYFIKLFLFVMVDIVNFMQLIWDKLINCEWKKWLFYLPVFFNHYLSISFILVLKEFLTRSITMMIYSLKKVVNTENGWWSTECRAYFSHLFHAVSACSKIPNRNGIPYS